MELPQIFVDCYPLVVFQFILEKAEDKVEEFLVAEARHVFSSDCRNDISVSCQAIFHVMDELVRMLALIKSERDRNRVCALQFLCACVSTGSREGRLLPQTFAELSCERRRHHAGFGACGRFLRQLLSRAELVGTVQHQEAR